MAAPGTEDAISSDAESETESFVDVLEELELQPENPVVFSKNEPISKPNLVASEILSSEDHSQGGAKRKTESSIQNESSHSQDESSHSQDESSYSSAQDDQNSEESSDDEEDRKQVINDLIREATEGSTEETREGHLNTEPSSELTESESEEEAEEKARKEAEAKMTEEEREAKREEAQLKKLEGNERFKAGNYQGALESYTDALMLCPLNYSKERSIMYSNRAACKYKLERHKAAIEDCVKALELNPVYLKALLRRAELYEKTDQLDEALADYTKALEMDRTLVQARKACQTLPDRIKERNEKLKEEMLGKLKDLGNMILRPFGLSTSNFKLQQDPVTGSYSVQFQQTPPPPPTNGK